MRQAGPAALERPPRHPGRSEPPPQRAEAMQTFLRSLGRAGQFAGLALPALAILLELQHAISLGQMLVMLVASVCCFWIGRIVEGLADR